MNLEIDPGLFTDGGRVKLALRRVPATKNLPKRQDHIHRGDCNTVPDGELTFVCNHPTRRKWRIYKDWSDREWLKAPWYLNVFHKPWAQRKFIYLDRESLETGLGSSEVQVNKKTGAIINEGSYNYRDFMTVGHWRHFIADILPVAIYLRR